MTDAPLAKADAVDDVDVPARAPRAFGTLLRLDRKLQRVEVALCAASLLLMIGLAFAQVLLRTFRTDVLQPVAWFDNIARHLVIWVGMLGASLCTAEGRHISIEALPKLFSVGGRRRNEAAVSLAALGVVAVLFTLSMIYMLRVQVPDPAAAFRIEALELDVHRWPLLAIVPVGLAVIGWRFGLRAAQALWMTDEEFVRREQAAEHEVAAADAALEAREAALLLEHDAQTARASGRAPTLTPDAARDEVRRLRSDRAPPQAPLPPTGLAAAAASAAAPPARSPAPPGRSTDEIPIYRDIADEGDRSEPAGRHGDAVGDSADGIEPAPALVDSEVLEPPSDVGLGDLSEDAVERLADTERLKIARPERTEPDEVQETDRLPRPELPADDGDGDGGEPDAGRGA